MDAEEDTVDDPNRTKLSTLAIALLVGAFPLISHAQNAGGACIRTPPSGQTLGAPFPQSENWYGSEALAVRLPADGVWRGMGPKDHYRDKLFWWTPGFRPGNESKLTVTGKRIDADAPPADISRATNAYLYSLGGWALLVAVEFPGPGRWQISGHYLGQELKFVVEIPRDVAKPSSE
ncbi:MAG: hypothetical protein ABI885_08405 [Gammaproteobacteria bacterium]